MARETKQPGVLRELWHALGNDPFIIAETLARASLVDRRARSLYASDARFHVTMRERAEAQLRGHATLDAHARSAGGNFREVEFVRVKGKAPRIIGDISEHGIEPVASTETGALELDAAEWDAERARLAEAFRDASCAGVMRSRDACPSALSAVCRSRPIASTSPRLWPTRNRV